MSVARPQSTHICTVVSDLDAVTDFYGSIMGVGPFAFEQVEAPDARWGHTSAPGAWRIASAPFGQAEMELIEVIEGRPPHVDFIERYGEGMNHVCWEAADGDAYGAQMLKLGLGAGMWPYWGYPEAGFAYVDSEEKAGGVAIEVISARRGFNHFGLAVNARDATQEFYEHAFGIGPFDDRDFPGKGFLYRGQRIDATFRVGFVRIGECRLEFVQPVTGDTPFQRHLDKRGEGLHNLRIDVADLDAAINRAAAQDIATEWSSPGQHRVQLASRAVGGMTISLAQL